MLLNNVITNIPDYIAKQVELHDLHFSKYRFASSLITNYILITNHQPMLLKLQIWSSAKIVTGVMSVALYM